MRNLLKMFNEELIRPAKIIEQQVEHAFAVLVKKKHDGVKVPVKSHDTDTGYDVFVDSIIEENELYIKYGTGLHLAPRNKMIDIRVYPRSGIYKQGLVLSNSIGLCDNGYRGEIMAVFYKIWGDMSTRYEIGERCMQLVMHERHAVEFYVIDELPKSSRGDGGFNSTGAR